jgi:hypothetical protein
VANERRYYEMLQVVETMREIGIKPIITNGTTAYFKQSREYNFRNHFNEKPDSIYEVIDYMETISND